MKKSILILALMSTVCLFAQTTVDFALDFADGWEPWIGQTVTFSNDFYVYNTTSRKVAYTRLRSPEEYGEEETALYEEAESHNAWASCTLSGVTFKSGYRPGTIVRGLQATVTAANKLQAVNTPTIIYNDFPTERPDLGNANVVVCAANIQNFFVTLGGYAGAENVSQLETQKTKISTALHHMDADIYALCEVEEGPLAATELVRLLNELAGEDLFDWINAGFNTYDAIMVCYIYRKDKLRAIGRYIMPYAYSAMHYRMAIQSFEHIDSGERFYLSLNHFYAKSGKNDADRVENMRYLMNQLPTIMASDPDVLVVGDLNAYTNEESNTILCQEKNFVDLLMRDDPEGYSYVYNNLVGYLDHAYCSPSMAPMVTKAVSYHLNADTNYRYAYTYGDTSMYRYADHDPILIGLQCGPMAVTVPLSGQETGVQKEIRHGQLIIVRSGVEYTITGQRL